MDSFNNFFKNVKKLFNNSTNMQFKNLDIGGKWDTSNIATPFFKRWYMAMPYAFRYQRDKVEDSKTLKSFHEVDHNRNTATPFKRSNKASPLSGIDQDRGRNDSNTTQKNINKGVLPNKNKVVSITYEEIGLFPRSFSRVLDRFLTQLFGDVETLLLQEYRFYRYLFLTTLKTIFLLIFVPLIVNFLAKNYIVRPLTEYFWNAKQTEIFLNSYEQKRAFAELHDFEDKLYFEALMFSHGKHNAYGNVHVEAMVDGKLRTRGIPEPIAGELHNTLHPFGISHSGLDISYRRDNGKHANDPDEVRHLSLMESSHYGVDQISQSIPLTGITESSKTTKLQESGICQLCRTAYQRDGKGIATPSTENDSGTFLKLPSNFNERYAIDQARSTPGISMIIKESQSRLQEKTMDLAQKYNKYSIEALTNLFSDLLSFLSLIYLLITLEIQINITKSFLLEVFFSFEDSKKSLLILLITDLLVGYHSSNLWELLFQFVFYHYGIPESQTGVYLLVATLPVLLDVLFKYLIFRHLNRSSPATVATYHAIIE